MTAIFIEVVNINSIRYFIKENGNQDAIGGMKVYTAAKKNF